MTEKQLKYAKSLRQKIMSYFARNNLLETRKELLKSWGYGESLRKLNIDQLQKVLAITQNKQQSEKTYKPVDYGEGKFDNQGNYMWSLMKQAKWDWKRVQHFMGHKYKTTHWNVLTNQQKRGVINMLKGYVNK